MHKTRITSNKVIEPPPQLWSNCIAVGPFVFLAGMTARNLESFATDELVRDEYQQAKTIFERMRHLMAAAGGEMNDIVKLTIFVTNIAKNTEVWRARREFFTGDFPACSLVEVRSLAKPEILVEIEGIAYLGSSKERAGAEH
jgi:enamine deaminase RidA (YjgF/YER057c/UK114 family)